MRPFSLFLFIGLFFLTSCHYFGGERIYGDGHIVTQQRNVGTFNSVDVSGSVKVHVRQDASPTVKIQTDQNLMEFLDVYTEGDVLKVHTRQGFNLNPSRDVIVYVTAPQYKDIDVSGACDIIGDAPINNAGELGLHVSGSGEINMQVAAPKVFAEVSGSGAIGLKGQATDFEAHVSGSGDIRCFDLVTDNTKLDISGASDVEVTANKQLNIEASGSSDVRYKGAANVSQSISGSGSVKRVS